MYLAVGNMATEVVSTFIETIQGIFEGVGTGIVGLFGELFYNSTTGLTSLASWLLVLMGISFALTIFWALFRKVGG